MDHLTLVLLILITFVCASLLIFFSSLFNQNPKSSLAKLPPGPRPFPIIGNILELGRNPHQALSNLSKIYGHVMILKLGNITTIVISSPQLAKQVLHEYDQNFSNRTVPHAVQALNHHMSSVVWLLQSSAHWRNFRKVCATKIFSPQQHDYTQILRQRKDLFVAGSDTTSSSVEWTMAELLHNPEKLEKARKELHEVIGKDITIEESHMLKLPYLQAVEKETLRLHPPVPILPRKSDENVEISNFIVPKNAQVLVNVWAMGRDPSIWENPNQFEPERFLESEIDYRGRDFELIPFGAGKRICPGLPLAHRALHLMVASLLHNYEWKLADGLMPENMNMKDGYGLAVKRVQPLRVHALPIKHS